MSETLKFDLFDLHVIEEDNRPKSWICANGKKLQFLLNQTINEIISKGKKSRRELAKMIANELDCNLYTVYNYLRGKRKFIPLILILKILEIYKNFCNKTINDINYLKEEFQEKIELLKNNTSISIPIKATKKLTTNLARIAGAHAADGNMTLIVTFSSKTKGKLINFKNLLKRKFSNKIIDRYTKIKKARNGYAFYLLLNSEENAELSNILIDKKINDSIKMLRGINITIVDEYKENLKYFVDWIKECFNLESKIEKLKNQNAWYVKISNKIIGRYFNLFLEFPYGKKYEIVKEPEIIKNAPYNYRKAFVQSVIMFDGSVSIDGRIEVASKSKYLLGSVKEIIKSKVDNKFLEVFYKDNIWYLRTKRSFDLKDYIKISQFLIKGSEKWRILHELVYGSRKKSESNMIMNVLKRYPRHSRVKLIDIFNVVKELKEVNILRIIQHLKKERGIGVSKETVSCLLRILRAMNIIRKNTKMYFTLDESFRAKLFQNCLIKLRTRKDLGKFLGVAPETTYDYEKGRIAIPKEKLSKILTLNNLFLDEISDKIVNKKEGINPWKFTFRFNSNTEEWRNISISN
jgi:hypothetical protein